MIKSCYATQTTFEKPKKQPKTTLFTCQNCNQTKEIEKWKLKMPGVVCTQCYVKNKINEIEFREDF